MEVLARQQLNIFNENMTPCFDSCVTVSDALERQHLHVWSCEICINASDIWAPEKRNHPSPLFLPTVCSREIGGILSFQTKPFFPHLERKQKGFVCTKHIFFQLSKQTNYTKGKSLITKSVYCSCGSVKVWRSISSSVDTFSTCWLSSKYHNNFGDHILMSKTPVPLGHYYNDHPKRATWPDCGRIMMHLKHLKMLGLFSPLWEIMAWEFVPKCSTDERFLRWQHLGPIIYFKLHVWEMERSATRCTGLTRLCHWASWKAWSETSWNQSGILMGGVRKTSFSSLCDLLP